MLWSSLMSHHQSRSGRRRTHSAALWRLDGDLRSSGRAMKMNMPASPTSTKNFTSPPPSSCLVMTNGRCWPSSFAARPPSCRKVPTCATHSRRGRCCSRAEEGGIGTGWWRAHFIVVHGVGVWREIREKVAAALRGARAQKSVLAACAILDACVACVFKCTGTPTWKLTNRRNIENVTKIGNWGGMRARPRKMEVFGRPKGQRRTTH